ncbi:CDP-glycerol glycerophosphotransferase family protein OS=Streptomyces microflavus OX=1919 GN=HUT09_12605 PE=3 SV=1 [Streptomyces microflavus]
MGLQPLRQPAHHRGLGPCLPRARTERLDLGYPRNDVYFTATAEDIAKIRAGLGIAEGQTALLYAPTHRDYREGFLPDLDPERLARERRRGNWARNTCSWCMPPLFYGRSAGAAGTVDGRVLDVTAHPRVEELCLAADALITDYSSLTSNYACLDRPVVVHAPDWAAYRGARGTYFDLLSGRPGDTPGPVTTTSGELVEAFRTGEWRSPASAALRTAFRERFCPYDDGHAAERVVRRFFGLPHSGLPHSGLPHSGLPHSGLPRSGLPH